jgi:hypothetical protein
MNRVEGEGQEVGGHGGMGWVKRRILHSFEASEKHKARAQRNELILLIPVDEGRSALDDQKLLMFYILSAKPGMNREIK